MRKISVLLAALLLICSLTACKPEAKTFLVADYKMQLTLDEEWVEPTMDLSQRQEATGKPSFDATYQSGDASVYIMGFRGEDFVDPPLPADEVAVQVQKYFSTCESFAEVAAAETYTVDSRTITVTRYSATEEGADWEYLSFLVEFNDDAGTFAWVLFRADAKYMKKNVETLKETVGAMTLQ